MSAHPGIIGQEVTGQMDRQSQTQGETDMHTVINKTQGRAGKKLTGLLRAALFGLALAAGLIGANPAALADPQPGTEQAGSRQADNPPDKKDQDAKPDNNGKDNSKDNDKQDRRDQPENHAPTLTLTAPTAGSASLYPAAITVAASIVYPVDDDAHDKDASPEHRRNFEVDFLVNGVKFAETERPPYQASYTPPQAGHYTFTARLRYGEGHRTILSGAVDTVSDLPPTVSLTAPVDNTVITAPATFTLSATASALIGSIAKVEFYSGTTLIGTATAAPYTASWANVPYGSYAITAKATDNYGFSTTTLPVTVISNAPPTVSLTAPANNSSAIAPANITLSANANDIDGTIAKVDFYASTTSGGTITNTNTNTNTLVGTAAAAPYTYAWSNVAVGGYTITAIATDNYGAQTISAAISVTVKPGVLLPYYIHTDQLDTPRVITDTAGNVVWEWQNTDPFGANIANDNPNGAGQFSFNLRFPGQYFDRETNTHYNVNRDYDPAIGRYIESDPLGILAGINTYTYVGGNPLNRIDQLGLKDYTDQCTGRYSNCAASQDPQASTIRNYIVWKACEASVNYSCDTVQPSGYCCDREAEQCRANVTSGDETAMAKCAIIQAQCKMKGK